MSPDTLTPSPTKPVSISLQNMLIREAALTLARRRIMEAIPVAQAREQEVRTTHAPFMILLPTKANQEIRATLQQSRQTLDVLQKALEKLTGLEGRLLPLVSYRLESHLRDSSQDYVGRLARNRSRDDWTRIQTRLEDCIRTYHDSLRSLAALCASAAPDTLIETHPPCHQVAARAITWGGRLEGEIRFINKIADAQCAHNGQGGFTLKRQTVVNWQESARSLLTMDAATGISAVGNLLTQSEGITRQILFDVASELMLIVPQDGPGTARYHDQLWAALREDARLKISPHDLEHLVRDTETLLDNGELETWSLLDDAPPAPPPAAPPPPSRAPVSTTPAPFAKPVPPPSNAPALKLPSRKATTAPFTPEKP